ncbi:alpha/beta hydrolase [Paraburkholderia acidisoli]|uniref:Alpha/beta hydrolase fold domain-containing protein n=1 Tax=Paraburkholderia acidisoli TaxID=2571748 RepID=A0A7Z2GKZ3_9BURK|nr:alpha/beta fold hydrolase [Paraburkholderia acidisoli]QGZ63364.1 alpha/beta hydrolase fold domain-containing protein [Paraburkholderia acidisoli]
MSGKRMLVYGCAIAVGAYVAAAAALYAMQDTMLLPSTPPAVDLRDQPHPGESVERWEVGGQYIGYVVTPEAGTPDAGTPAAGMPAAGTPRGTVIVYHGNEESAETKLPLANVFVHAGYRVVIVEYPGHGNRGGARTMRAALAASRDVFARTRARWPGAIWLVGESLGAGMAARVVQGNEAALAGVVLITPWDTLASVAGEKYPMFPVRWLLHDPFDSIAAVAAYGGPLVVVASAQDTLIPPAHAEHLVAGHPGSRLMMLPNADHDTWFDAMTPARWQQVLQWIGA